MKELLTKRPLVRGMVEHPVRTTFGLMTGYLAVKNYTASNANAIGSSLSSIGAMAKALWQKEANRPDSQNDIPDHLSPEKRFQAEMMAAGYKRSHIPAVRKGTAVAAYVTALGIAVILALSVWFPTEGIWSFAKAMIGLSLLASSIKHAYANWIVRHQRHEPFSAFVKSGDWLPRL